MTLPPFYDAIEPYLECEIMEANRGKRMKWLKKLIWKIFGRFMTDIDKMPVPVSNRVISRDELAKILRHIAGDGDIYLSDNIYTVADWDDIATMLAYDQTNRYEYIAEKLDCDDFAYMLMGQFSVPGWARLAFGIVWTDLHALNCFVDEELKFYFVEPQTDEIIDDLIFVMGNRIRFIIM